MNKGEIESLVNREVHIRAVVRALSTNPMTGETIVQLQALDDQGEPIDNLSSMQHWYIGVCPGSLIPASSTRRIPITEIRCGGIVVNPNEVEDLEQMDLFAGGI